MLAKIERGFSCALQRIEQSAQRCSFIMDSIILCLQFIDFCFPLTASFRRSSVCLAGYVFLYHQQPDDNHAEADKAYSPTNIGQNGYAYPDKK
jgi:hypothetical protein